MKYATWIITDSVSNIYTKPINKNATSLCKITEIAAKIPPRANDPVSPINIFAGFLLNNKNPISAPTIVKQNTNTGKLFSLYAYKANVLVVIIVTLVANPSNPSVKFTALEKPVCQNTKKII